MLYITLCGKREDNIKSLVRTRDVMQECATELTNCGFKSKLGSSSI